jgi:hypothetical protein
MLKGGAATLAGVGLVAVPRVEDAMASTQSEVRTLIESSSTPGTVALMSALKRSSASRSATARAAAALVGFGLAAPAAAQVFDQPPAVSVYTLTPERIAATVAAVVGLIGMALGALALARSRRIA